MRRSLKTLIAANLLAAPAVLLNPVPIFAARALQPPELLAAAYQGSYDAAYQSSDSTVEPVRSRRAAQQAADQVARDKGRNVKQFPQSNAADEAALKAATAALKVAPPGWQISRTKVAYTDAYKAAYDALSRETTGRSDPDAQRLPANLRALASRGAKIRADRDAAKVAAANAVDRAVSQKITAEESAGDRAADDHSAADRKAAEK